ncbi:hypothetical protein PR048_015301 [Dryococelus australis]|uniref:Uncharacterized protein n=1 Tax=Dryococelus australis TaxID=614101 RepID=A0ABQ9HGK5_9NEOP|nr:hypothetical protein PR048_015301 [Dryococelus australis]
MTSTSNEQSDTYAVKKWSLSLVVSDFHTSPFMSRVSLLLFYRSELSNSFAHQLLGSEPYHTYIAFALTIWKDRRTPNHAERTSFLSQIRGHQLISRLSFDLLPPLSYHCCPYFHLLMRDAQQPARRGTGPPRPIHLSGKQWRVVEMLQVSWCWLSAVHTRHTQQELETTVESGEATLTRELRSTHYTRAVTSTALLLQTVAGKCWIGHRCVRSEQRSLDGTEWRVLRKRLLVGRASRRHACVKRREREFEKRGLGGDSVTPCVAAGATCAPITDKELSAISPVLQSKRETDEGRVSAGGGGEGLLVTTISLFHPGAPGSIPGGIAPESCRTMPLVGGFSQGFPIYPALAFRYCSIRPFLHPHLLSRPRYLKPAKITNLNPPPRKISTINDNLVPVARALSSSVGTRCGDRVADDSRTLSSSDSRSAKQARPRSAAPVASTAVVQATLACSRVVTSCTHAPWRLPRNITQPAGTLSGILPRQTDLARCAQLVSWSYYWLLTKANQARLPGESYRTMPLVGEFARGSHVLATQPFRRCSILPRFASLILKTSMLRAAQIFSLHTPHSTLEYLFDMMHHLMHILPYNQSVYIEGAASRFPCEFCAPKRCELMTRHLVAVIRRACGRHDAGLYVSPFAEGGWGCVGRRTWYPGASHSATPHYTSSACGLLYPPSSTLFSFDCTKRLTALRDCYRQTARGRRAPSLYCTSARHVDLQHTSRGAAYYTLPTVK